MSLEADPPSPQDSAPALPAAFDWVGEHIGWRRGPARVLLTTRRGGVSRAPWASLNLGAQVDDDPAAVDANRARVAAVAGLEWKQVRHARQVHGAVVSGGRAAGSGGLAARSGGPAAEPGGALADDAADGQVVGNRGTGALVLVADCLPIALATDDAVAVLHGGWRGLDAGIVTEGVRVLRQTGAGGDIASVLGPCARACCYEVGEEVHDRFAGFDARRGERNLDLAAVARHQLEQVGVDTIDDCGLCTMCRPDLFFSHRRDAGRTGRQAALAWLA